ncbi:cytochrome c oxidase subunit 6b-3-like isoform X1 [Diospyros lotus]|uniref:cytochrome c oxidase subunit 6b-3-like isoform X1 n=1 Tax=Diospyros lotus TaxID=55363 RepID=UPI00224CE123|nr:cytochrome c oxidase subunit 6b-3-like isoform X1 [Diospyros lotus]
MPFSGFWLRSSVYQSLIADTWAIGSKDIKLIFLGHFLHTFCPPSLSPFLSLVSKKLSLRERTRQATAYGVSHPSQVELRTAPADFRFPTTNQTRHCFTRYIEFHRCLAVKGEEASECDKFAKYYRSLCPGEWVERWNEQRENGTFPGPL